jgi:hypothetical protein
MVSLVGPSIYYVCTFLDFFWLSHPLRGIQQLCGHTPALFDLLNLLTVDSFYSECGQKWTTYPQVPTSSCPRCFLEAALIRTNAVLNDRKNRFFLPTHPFCWRNIWMVPGQDGKQGSKEDDNVSNSLWGLGAQSKTTLKSERAHFRVMGKFKLVLSCLSKDYFLWKRYIFHQISPKMTTDCPLSSFRLISEQSVLKKKVKKNHHTLAFWSVPNILLTGSKTGYLIMRLIIRFFKTGWFHSLE